MIDTQILHKVKSAMEWKGVQSNDRFYNHKHKDAPKTNRQALIRLSHQMTDVMAAIKEDGGFFAKWVAEMIRALSPSISLDDKTLKEIPLIAGAVH